MRYYFAVTDDWHDVRHPVTVVRVIEGLGAQGIHRLNEDAVWTKTALLDQIESGEVPYRLRPIAAAAIRIRRGRERTIAFRYSILVREDDPTDTPINVLREWDASEDGWQYSEVFSGKDEDEWVPSNIRSYVERSNDIGIRILPCDEATARRFIESKQRSGS